MEYVWHMVELGVGVTNVLVYVSNRWVADEDRIPHPVKHVHQTVVTKMKVTHVRITWSRWQ